jgi:hypothetical protein
MGIDVIICVIWLFCGFLSYGITVGSFYKSFFPLDNEELLMVRLLGFAYFLLGIPSLVLGVYKIITDIDMKFGFKL